MDLIKNSAAFVLLSILAAILTSLLAILLAGIWGVIILLVGAVLGMGMFAAALHIMDRR